MTCPRIPWGRATRPTTAMSSQLSDTGVTASVANLERDRLAFLLARRRGERAQRGGGPSLLADDAPEFAGRDVQLDERRAPVLRLGHLHLVGTIGERPREHLDDLQHAAAVGHGCHSVTAATAGAAGASGVRWRAISVRTESDGCAPFLTQ